MKKSVFLKLTLLNFALLIIAENSVFANEIKLDHNSNLLQQIENYNDENNYLNQVNSISQLRDVSPTDWAYSALQNLVENYDCLEGYPNRTFRGVRTLTRGEFAAGVDGCFE